MKKRFITIFLLLLSAYIMYAAKSVGKSFLASQPDGTSLSVRLLGDEHFNWYQTMDGTLLVKENKSFYVAEVCIDGSLVSSGVLAHDAEARSEKEATLVKSQNQEAFFMKERSVLSAVRKQIDGYPSKTFGPHMGNVRIPVIMMEYPDLPFTFDRSVIDSYFNSDVTVPYSSATRFDGYSSVGRYFKDASNGKFTPVFDIYGPYTPSNKHDYYGNAGSKSFGLLSEAVTLSDGDIDFSQYDSNDDGFVDYVFIIYSGTGANLSGDDSDFWPACWYSISMGTQDGKRINVIGGSSELAIPAELNPNGDTPVRSGIGIFCHEMSHGLGLPDLYWTLVASPKNASGEVDWDNCGPEDWDLMDGGENLFNGMWPCQYAAWERDVMGWLDVEELTEPADITIYPLNKEGGKAYRVTNPNDPKEYYIIENIANDEWNKYLDNRYGTGLMITHLNDPAHKSMSPNNTYGKPNITILPADGYILASYSIDETIMYHGEKQTITRDMFRQDAKGDHYPGSQNVTSLNAYKNYSGEEMVSRYPITDIRRNSDGSISFKFMGGKVSVPADVNADGTVDVSDINAVISVICGTTTNPSADVNADGTVDVSDINAIISVICGK